MTTRVLYKPEERVLDLSSLSASDCRLLRSLHSAIDPGDRVLICLEMAKPEHDEMHVERVDGG